MLAFCLVRAYHLLEDRRTIDVIITKFFSPCFKMAKSFENLDNILGDRAKDKGVHLRHLGKDACSRDSHDNSSLVEERASPDKLSWSTAH